MVKSCGLPLAAYYTVSECTLNTNVSSAPQTPYDCFYYHCLCNGATHEQCVHLLLPCTAGERDAAGQIYIIQMHTVQDIIKLLLHFLHPGFYFFLEWFPYRLYARRQGKEHLRHTSS